MSISIQRVVSNSELRMMVRIIAAIVLHEGAAYMPLLQRLKRQHDEASRGDPSAYARRLLAEFTE